MARAKKEYRELTVSEATNYGRKTAPMLRIHGLWFQELEFNIGDPVLVKCAEGKLVIMKDSTRAELIEAEKAFMEEETRKLQERFLKEKKELHARFVAERHNAVTEWLRKADWRRRMFNNDNLKCLDLAYFNIIAVDDYDVTIMSRNTGYYWYEWPDVGSVVVFHKHRYQHPTISITGQIH